MNMLEVIETDLVYHASTWASSIAANIPALHQQIRKFQPQNERVTKGVEEAATLQV